MQTRTYDVIMAGGGVMGCATAYYLLKHDPNLKIAIIEKDLSYQYNSTVLSDGNIRVQFNIKENVQISQFGLERLATFAEDMAVGDKRPEPAFRQEGNLFLSTPDNQAGAHKAIAQQQSLGCQVEWWTAAEIEERLPLYRMPEVAGGAYGSQDGTLDPNSVLIGFKDKAIDLGADMIEAEVAEVLHADGQVTGVRLASGETLAAKFVVNSAGAWGTQLAHTVGIALPIDPVRRQVFIFETNAQPQRPYPLTVFPSGLYLIHEHGGQFMAGRSLDTDPVGFDFGTDRNVFMDILWPELVEYVPVFDQLKVTSSWSGLYAVNTFDGNAFLGEWPELAGFILVNGFSGHGFQQCWGVGRYLAELIRGVPFTLDLSIFSPRRLLENTPVFEGEGKLV